MVRKIGAAGEPARVFSFNQLYRYKNNLAGIWYIMFAV
jgi:hypothetical protein